MRRFLGYRKWSVGVIALLLGFIAAIAGKLTPELAGLIGAVATGFFTANGYTTGRGKEPSPESTGSPSEIQ
jgi:hypothetical protein